MKNTFTTVARFNYSSEAHIIKGKLNSEGVEAFLVDDMTIDVDPLVSHAIGGVKLKVPTIQLERAKEVLESIHKYSIDDSGNRITCPNCKSNKVNLVTTVRDKKGFIFFIIAFLYTMFPFFVKSVYKCEDCKEEFKE
jgi:DNA-directed RNA polymerase subunit RPC12/RpoP